MMFLDKLIIKNCIITEIIEIYKVKKQISPEKKGSFFIKLNLKFIFAINSVWQNQNSKLQFNKTYCVTERAKL